MTDQVSSEGKRLTGLSVSADLELVEMLLEMSDKEIGHLDSLYRATAHVRSSDRTRQERRDGINRVLDEDQELRAAFRALTGSGHIRQAE